ncbi:VWA domain-containing protein [Nocardioides mangrovicus]|uniref:VWA domain-containing protein n=2 Tax=Nocardioides mangrovicus TaxID=2478913 RepID=A0A3L8P1W2_9ACTN|nr:VWA domain-containing protein [Nocardioides mangrovicus]
MATATDERLREAARRLAARLFWSHARRGAAEDRGVSRMRSVRHRPHEGDVDLERSTDALVRARAAGQAVDPDDLWTTTWRRAPTAWCLLLDRSGSMHGEALATAALATGAFLLRAGRERAVLSFADDVVALASMADGRRDDDVLDRVLALRGSGTTELATALDAAADQLGRTAARRRVTVLLSDCRATRPEEVPAAAGRHEELVVLAPAGDPAAALALARATGARVATVSGPSQVPAALARLLDA